MHDRAIKRIVRIIAWLERLKAELNAVRFAYAVEEVKKNPAPTAPFHYVTKVVDENWNVIATFQEFK